MLASFNIGALNNSSLFYSLEHFLSKDPTNEELTAKSQCLLVFFICKGLELVLKTITNEEDSLPEYDPMYCAMHGAKEAFHIFLSYFPEKLNTVGGCEGFDWVGAQEKKVSHLNQRFSFDFWGIN